MPYRLATSQCILVYYTIVFLFCQPFCAYKKPLGGVLFLFFRKKAMGLDKPSDLWYHEYEKGGDRMSENENKRKSKHDYLSFRAIITLIFAAGNTLLCASFSWGYGMLHT